MPPSWRLAHSTTFRSTTTAYFCISPYNLEPNATFGDLAESADQGTPIIGIEAPDIKTSLINRPDDRRCAGLVDILFDAI